MVRGDGTPTSHPSEGKKPHPSSLPEAAPNPPGSSSGPRSHPQAVLLPFPAPAVLTMKAREVKRKPAMSLM